MCDVMTWCNHVPIDDDKDDGGGGGGGRLKLNYKFSCEFALNWLTISLYMKMQPLNLPAKSNQ